ncbi:MAG: hypothetical protein GTN89_08885 [Acidobacteria bacterium]|nr:hypothetical protein [Acidobacteriota bacterium]NIM64191.1 hypothetical protein [Acidobacteriota bacterium]NIO59434.1 hypothetical protein [Acidobacteriota bacterium]NIQ30469.1 hypothetical protein [Acidobacteriota bacterium]NIQ85404.1 hypothetical protein [Acidobacteriota bacterium]
MNKIPIIILAGSDGRPGQLPEGVDEVHSLSGLKGADLRIDGIPLVNNVIQRIRASESFGPVYLAGPARVYRSICPEVDLVDTNADFGTNIDRSLRSVQARHPGEPVAFITCDILPEAETLDAMAADFRRAAPCDLWYSLVRVPPDPRELGASAWKPRYFVRPARGQKAVEVLGGHLVIVDPPALRLDFVRRLFSHVYATRNRTLAYRRSMVLFRMIGSLLVEDCRRLLTLRWPDITWVTVRAGVHGASRLGRGRITLTQLERVLSDLLIRRDRTRKTGCRVRVPLVDQLSLALDIDTEEEALSWGAS